MKRKATKRETRRGRRGSIRDLEAKLNPSGGGAVAGVLYAAFHPNDLSPALPTTLKVDSNK